MTAAEVFFFFKKKLAYVEGMRTTGWVMFPDRDDPENRAEVRCYVTSRVHIQDLPKPKIEGVEVISANAYEDDENWTKCIWKVKLK